MPAPRISAVPGGLRDGETIAERGLTGRVKWYDTQRGFGRIITDDQRDIFVAYACLLTPRRTGPNQETIELLLGDRVTFDIATGGQEPKAVNVELVQ